MDVLKEVLGSFSPQQSFKMLHPDEWGTSPWYPLLALKELEEATFPIVKGRKAILKSLAKSRQRREWVIGNYYWALWKWHMKNIHDARFTFVPHMCRDLLRQALLVPVPRHLLVPTTDGTSATTIHGDPTELTTHGQEAGPAQLPPPVSLLLRKKKLASATRLSSRGEEILQALRGRTPTQGPWILSSWERILRALTDDAYA